MPSRTQYFGYDFTNIGPLTTTYEPPASCTTATTDHIYFANATSLEQAYGSVKCDGPEPVGKCYPSGATYDSLLSSYATYRDQGFWQYFSPGVVCPKGWTTAVLGIITVLMRVFSGWSAGQWGGCFSSIEPLKSATYSEYCNAYAPASAGVEVHTVEGTSVATALISWRSVTDLTTRTMAISDLKDSSPTGFDDLAVARNLPAVALVYKPSDVKKAKDSGDGESEESKDAKADDDNGASTLNGGSFIPLVAVLFSMLVGAGMLAPGF
ncbi:Ff.00g037630.m01.CDS01 [Fusarium sp. VM40]|nr:Ff.00g037630.m01.CDS01 [Fusarium sp. VM40]